MRLLINIRGTNGAGKSTVPLQMVIRDNGMKTVQVPDSKARVTVFPLFGWVALGSYLNKTGGLDTMRTNEDTRRALLYAITEYPDYDILMEGIIASTVKSTYLALFQEVERDYDIKAVVLSYTPPLETCLERVRARNGGKPVKEDQVASKWRSVATGVSYFKEGGITSLKYDTSRIGQADMLRMFLDNVTRLKLKGDRK